jgi:hypothetical protein
MMGTIKVKSPKSGREISFERGFGDSLADSIKTYGEDVVHSIFCAQAVIKCQAAARSTLDALNDDGTPVHTEEEAVEAGMGYTPGVVTRAPKKSAFETLLAQVRGGNAPPDLLEQIRAAQEAANGSNGG